MTNRGVSFHESTLLGVQRLGSSIMLLLDSVYADGERKPASVRLDQVGEITSDGTPVEGFSR